MPTLKSLSQKVDTLTAQNEILTKGIVTLSDKISALGGSTLRTSSPPVAPRSIVIPDVPVPSAPRVMTQHTMMPPVMPGPRMVAPRPAEAAPSSDDDDDVPDMPMPPPPPTAGEGKKRTLGDMFT